MILTTNWERMKILKNAMAGVKNLEKYPADVSA